VDLGGTKEPSIRWELGSPRGRDLFGGLYYTVQAANAHSSTALLTCPHTMAEVRLLGDSLAMGLTDAGAMWHCVKI